MKRWFVTWCLLAAGALSAGPTVLRDAILPGAAETPEWYKADSFAAAAPESGTLALWLRPEQWDAFYEVLSAVILGLLRHRNAVRIFWRDGARDLQWDVADTQSCRAFFLRLYRSEPPDGTPEPVLTDFALNTKLCWTRGAELLWRFDASDPVPEILEKTFVV